jgi:hypothetical protein
VDASLPDWVGVLFAVVCVGGSIAFGLILYARRDGGRAYRNATNDLLRQVALQVGGEFRPAPAWPLHPSMRVFGAAVGVRANLAYEVSRYPFHVEDAGGRPYVAIRPRAGGPVLPDSGHVTERAVPELERALGPRIARRLPPDAVEPLLALVHDGSQAFSYRSTLFVVPPAALWSDQRELTTAELSEWVERVITAAQRLYPVG